MNEPKLIVPMLERVTLLIMAYYKLNIGFERDN